MIKYRLVQMYNKHIFQIESMDNYGSGGFQIKYTLDDKPIYYVTVASNSFISFSKEDKHNTIQGNYTVMTIRLDGSTESRRNELCIISSELTDMDKKIFNHSIKTWNSYSHQLESLSFNINDL